MMMRISQWGLSKSMTITKHMQIYAHENLFCIQHCEIMLRICSTADKHQIYFVHSTVLGGAACKYTMCESALSFRGKWHQIIRERKRAKRLKLKNCKLIKKTTIDEDDGQVDLTASSSFSSSYSWWARSSDLFNDDVFWGTLLLIVISSTPPSTRIILYGSRSSLAR